MAELKQTSVARYARVNAARHVGVEWHEHEGMVTVYYSDGRYAGCMGVERWARLLREDREVSNPATEPDA